MFEFIDKLFKSFTFFVCFFSYQFSLSPSRLVLAFSTLSLTTVFPLESSHSLYISSVLPLSLSLFQPNRHVISDSISFSVWKTQHTWFIKFLCPGQTRGHLSTWHFCSKNLLFYTGTVINCNWLSNSWSPRRNNRIDKKGWKFRRGTQHELSWSYSVE